MRAPTVEEKLCPNCNERKRAPLFYPNTITPDGLSENCRSCCKVREPHHDRSQCLASHHTSYATQLRGAPECSDITCAMECSCVGFMLC